MAFAKKERANVTKDMKAKIVRNITAEMLVTVDDMALVLDQTTVDVD